jgi:CRP-like cAMP-binding protein
LTEVTGGTGAPLPRPSVPDAEAAANRQLLENVICDARLAGSWQELTLRAGDILFRQGDEADGYYLVMSGCLEVSREEEDGQLVSIARIGALGHAGELAMIDGGARSATVRCVTDATVRRLGRAEYLAALSQCPDLAALTATVLAARLRRVLNYLDYVTGWARAITSGDYEGARLRLLEQAQAAPDPNAQRFADTFVDMLAAVQAREEALRRELHQLRIDYDPERRAVEVSEITEADFFRSLLSEAARLRRRVREGR